VLLAFRGSPHTENSEYPQVQSDRAPVRRDSLNNEDVGILRRPDEQERSKSARRKQRKRRIPVDSSSRIAKHPPSFTKSGEVYTPDCYNADETAAYRLKR